MTTVVIDLERIRFLACGLGQFSLHLGRSILEAAGRAPQRDIDPVFLLPPGGECHFAGQPVRHIISAAWRRDGVVRWLRPLAACWPRRAGADVWHVTHQDSKFWPLDRRTPVVYTVHDLNFLREKPPHVIRRRLARLRRRVAAASILTTGSQHAAQEIAEYLQLRGKEVRVIPHGICLDRTATPFPPAGIQPDVPFLFTIGDISPKKNFHVLVDMLARLGGWQLVIAGARTSDYATSIERRAQELGIADRVRLTGCVTEAERNWLYANCGAFVFPSLTEGFGLPLIEAMSFGRPSFAARRTSLPEVGGPCAFYWNDFDADSMVATFRTGLAAYAADPTYSEKLRSWASQFSWPKSAGQYLDLYREVQERFGQQRGRAA